MFLTCFVWIIFSIFCYIAKYWNSDRNKLLVRNVRAYMLKRTLKPFFERLYFFRKAPKISDRKIPRNKLFILIFLPVYSSTIFDR